MTTTRDGTRCPLVFASRAVLDAAAKVVPSHVVIEMAVARGIARGQVSRQPRPGEPKLSGRQLIVRPFDSTWVAVVRRGTGRLIRKRPSNCWEVVRVVEVR